MSHAPRAFLAGLFLFVVFVLAGCARKQAEPEPLAQASRALAPEAAERDPDSEATLEAPSADRRIVHRAGLTLSAEAVATAADQAVAAVAASGGFTHSRNDQHSGEHVVESTLSLRVPAARFQQALGAIKGVGSVVEERVSGEDVTAEFVDLVARLKAQRVLEERLLGLSGEQRGVAALLEVERELSRVRTEVERLEGQRRLLDEQTRFGTIDLVIRSPEQPRVAGIVGVGSRLGNAVSEGVELSVAVTAGLIQVGFAFLPFLPVPVFGYLLFRMLRRRQAFSRAGRA